MLDLGVTLRVDRFPSAERSPFTELMSTERGAVSNNETCYACEGKISERGFSFFAEPLHMSVMLPQTFDLAAVGVAQAAKPDRPSTRIAAIHAPSSS